jgi:hypothetical protein
MVVVMRNSSRRDQVAVCKSAFHEAIKGFECARRERSPGNGTMGFVRNRLGSKAAILGSLAIRDTPSTLLKLNSGGEAAHLRNFNHDVYWHDKPKSMFPRVNPLTTKLRLAGNLDARGNRHAIVTGLSLIVLTGDRGWPLSRIGCLLPLLQFRAVEAAIPGTGNMNARPAADRDNASLDCAKASAPTPEAG